MDVLHAADVMMAFVASYQMPAKAEDGLCHNECRTMHQFAHRCMGMFHARCQAQALLLSPIQLDVPCGQQSFLLQGAALMQTEIECWLESGIQSLGRWVQ